MRIQKYLENSLCHCEGATLAPHCLPEGRRAVQVSDRSNLLLGEEIATADKRRLAMTSEDLWVSLPD